MKNLPTLRNDSSFAVQISNKKEIREPLVYFRNYDGVISDEKFVPLYGEI